MITVNENLCRRRPQTLTNPLYGLGLISWFSCPNNFGNFEAWKPGQPQQAGGSHAALPWGCRERFRVSLERAGNVAEPSGKHTRASPEAREAMEKLPGTRFEQKPIICCTSTTSCGCRKKRKNTIVSPFSNSQSEARF